MRIVRLFRRHRSSSNNYYICYYWDKSKILETTTIIVNYRLSIYRIAAARCTQLSVSRHTPTAAAPSSEGLPLRAVSTSAASGFQQYLCTIRASRRSLAHSIACNARQPHSILLLPRCSYAVARSCDEHLSVCLSVKRVDCDKTKETFVNILIPYERSMHLVLPHEEWLVGTSPST